MKKILCALIVVCGFIRSLPTVSAAFQDVPASHPNKEAIDYVQEKQIVSGYPDGSFQPDRVLNRAEFTKIIVGSRLAAGSINACLSRNTLLKKRIFSDVPKSSWFEKFVCSAKVGKIIAGYSDGSFQPEKGINVAEAAKIVSGSYGLKITAGEPRRGELVEPWFAPYLERLSELSALPDSIAKISSLTKKASKALTRGEMAEMIYRLRTLNDSVISSDGLATIRIPESLLPEGIERSAFSVTKIEENPLKGIANAPTIVYRLEPHGLQFSSPITLQLSAPMVGDAVPIVFLVSGDSFDLIPNPIIELHEGVKKAEISAELAHFSEVTIVFLNFLRISSSEVTLSASPVSVSTLSGKTITIQNALEISSASGKKSKLKAGEKTCVDFPAQFTGTFEQDSLVKPFTFTIVSEEAAKCPIDDSPDIKAMKDKVIELTNIERAKVGAAPVKYNAFLEKAAQGYGEELFEKNYLEHYSPEGVGTEERILDSGYLDAMYACECGNNFSVGENLGKEQKTPEEVVKGWMNSPTHRENLLKPEYRDIGIGMVKNTKTSQDGLPPGGYIWIQNFGVFTIPTAQP